MTTIIEYKYYNIETHKHEGVHPNLYWETKKVPLHGCTGVSVCLQIYPHGHNAANRGYASIYAVLHSDAKHISVKLGSSFTIDTITTTLSAILVEQGGAYWAGFGDGTLCDSAKVQQGQVFLSCMLNVEEFTIRSDKETKVEYPTGKCLYQLIN